MRRQFSWLDLSSERRPTTDKLHGSKSAFVQFLWSQMTLSFFRGLKGVC